MPDNLTRKIFSAPIFKAINSDSSSLGPTSWVVKSLNTTCFTKSMSRLLGVKPVLLKRVFASFGYFKIFRRNYKVMILLHEANGTIAFIDI